MSFVLSIVCVRPVARPIPAVPPLIVQEAVQDAGARSRAGYLDGLAGYFGEPVEGTVYRVFVDVGEKYPSSAIFFPWPEDDPDDSKPIKIRVDTPYRLAFDTLLRELSRASAQHKVLIICEWNGDVTQMGSSQESAASALADGSIHLYGPLNIREFWEWHDAGRIEYPSVTILESAGQMEEGIHMHPSPNCIENG